MSARRAVQPRALGALPVALLLAFAFPAAVQGHVNRQAGPYAFLVVLVEEPTFEDDHAGFQFWVRRDGVPQLGLDASVHAVATGHGQRIDLAVPPVDAIGFYVLDHSTNGFAFDPLGGGSWTLELTGIVEGTPIDVTFPVTFPSYPRVAAPQPAPATAASDAGAPDSLPIPLLLGAALAMVGVVVAVRAGSRRGVRAS